MKISDDLLKKYNLPVPRYTSYPPANQFKETFSESNYLQLVKDSNNEKPESIALYIHIPFCKKICHYCGCNACSIGTGKLIKPYMDAVRNEIELVSEFIDKRRPVTMLHYGGGTPNSLDISFLSEMNEYLFSKFSFVKDPEVAIECNPAYLSFSYIEKLVASGFNRFSLGIQDFNDNILRQVNREPSAIPPDELVMFLKAAGHDINVNLDFIYGLPGQTVESFLKTIEEAIMIRPDRLVTFSYAHVPWLKKHQMILEKAGLPAPEVKMQMFLEAYSLLKDSGYKPIGLDHFVLPEDDLYVALIEHKLHRNFQGYCTRRTTGQVYAFGITAISQLERGYSQNIKSLTDYISLIEKEKVPVERGYILTEQEMLTRTIITELMCNKKLNYEEIAGLHHLTKNELIKKVCPEDKILEGFRKDGLIEFNNDEIEVTERGSLFIRNIAASYDREYKQTTKTYSRTV